MVTTTGTFETYKKNFVSTAKTGTGSGFLPLVIRSLLHIVWAASIVKESKEPNKTDVIKAELDEAFKHFTAAPMPEILSDKSKTMLLNLGNMFKTAQTEFADWDETTMTSNLQTLSSNVLEVAAALDREVLGLKSDPGTSL